MIKNFPNKGCPVHGEVFLYREGDKKFCAQCTYNGYARRIEDKEIPEVDRVKEAERKLWCNQQ